MGLIKRILELPKTSTLRKNAEEWLNTEPKTSHIINNKYQYIGKSKKIETKNVLLIECIGEDKCKVMDENGNYTTILKKLIV